MVENKDFALSLKDFAKAWESRDSELSSKMAEAFSNLSNYYNCLCYKDISLMEMLKEDRQAMKGYELIALMLVFVSSKQADTYDARKKACCEFSFKYWDFFEQRFNSFYKVDISTLKEPFENTCLYWLNRPADSTSIQEKNARLLDRCFSELKLKALNLHSTLRQSALESYFRYLYRENSSFREAVGKEIYFPFI